MTRLPLSAGMVSNGRVFESGTVIRAGEQLPTQQVPPMHASITAQLSSLLTIHLPRALRLQMGELKLKESLLTELKSTVLKLQAENSSLEQVRHSR